MQLGRYQVSTLRPAPILSIKFSQDGRFFAVASETGYEIWRSFPLGLLRRRSLPGTLALALPLPNSPLLVLQGGGNAPLYPPNKAVIYHDGLGAAVAELEFGEKIRGIVARQGTICIALVRRTIAFEYGIGDQRGKGKAKETQDGHGSGFWLSKIGEWETAPNELGVFPVLKLTDEDCQADNNGSGLIALATVPGSTLLALPGRQPGHVQLINLPRCPAPAKSQSQTPSSSIAQPYRSPIILAHTHPLSTLSCTATGSHVITASERGTLLRVWDTSRGRLERELRRGVDRAEIWGVTAEDAVLREWPTSSSGDADKRRDEVRRKGGRVVGWSDKGTVHVWGAVDDDVTLRPPNAPSLTHLLSRNLPLPKYFSSTASSAQYHLPRKNPHAFASVMSGPSDEADELSERFVVGWIEVQVQVDPPSSAPHTPAVERRGSSDFRRISGGMGSREERHSFGSDETSSRTATPTLIGRGDTSTTKRGGGGETPTPIPTPTTTGPRRQSTLSIVPGSTGSKKDRNRVKTASIETTIPKLTTRTESQLVAITYSGDWYRLRIPEPTTTTNDDKDKDKDDDERNNGKCQLVEYRRLGVGGRGW
ncbi:hypothetical protein BCR39DRAFT_585627 [Naematelia encephala]|uniref:WD40-repeat-containing domain protein n=1 Tax=Naematelia encephala TaxID=71784 RepID=A0A1Y2BIQ0_9TREE|nr:hypothetical protein BCR39DRAFT_585627 [Naematelia encephala]